MSILYRAMWQEMGQPRMLQATYLIRLAHQRALNPLKILENNTLELPTIAVPKDFEVL